MTDTKGKPADDAAQDTESTAGTTESSDSAPRQKEIGGRAGPDPTRFGDWEKNGRCIDF